MEHACLSVLNDDSKNNQSTSFSCKIQFAGAAQAQKANKQDVDMSNSLAGVGKQKREDLEVRKFGCSDGLGCVSFGPL